MQRHIIIVARLVFCLAPLVLWPNPAPAEKVWDNDLKRYLTEAELNHAEVFMSEEEAVKIMLPKSERIRRVVLELTQ